MNRTGFAGGCFEGGELDAFKMAPRGAAADDLGVERPSALVLCAAETSHIQAHDRTRPLLPMRPGQADSRIHDHTRHGTTALFAALDVATGAGIARCYQTHRSSEFRARNSRY